MLVQFSVENFLSFNEEQVFSMVAAVDNQHPAHLIPDVPRKGNALLRGAAIYGANAAGKSNLVHALRFAQTLILEGTRGSQSIPVRPFRLGGSEPRPSKFEFIIHSGGVLYNYGFRVDFARVWEEWLFATPAKQEVPFFQRTTDESGKTQVEFGPSFKGRSKRQEQFLDFVAQGTRPNQLFLTEAAERNVAELSSLVAWFQESLTIISAETQATGLEVEAQESADFSAFLSAFLSAAGTGIDNVTTEETPFDIDKQIPGLPSQTREQIVTRLRQNEAVLLNLHGPQGERYMLRSGQQGHPVRLRLRLQHQSQDGNPITFDVSEESEGTQRLIHLLPALLLLKRTPGKVVILDELDRRLHPLLSRLLVQTALESDAEQGHSQLIFTTHDTNLLDLDLLRRDEIWFVEKDGGGASHIYSLGEFKVRPDLKIEKGYLNGRFGAIPFIGDVSKLGWTGAPSGQTQEPAKADLAA